MAKKYKVEGTYNGKQISEVVEAHTKKQAKLKAGFDTGLGGALVRCKSVKVRMVK